jgi:hypothetical protein
MAFIHTAGGHVIRVTAGREAIAMALQQRLGTNELLEFEAEGPSPVKVTLNAQQIAIVSEEPLPGAL